MKSENYDNNDDDDNDDDDNNNNNNNNNIIIIIIIVISFNGAVQESVQSPHCAAYRLQHVRFGGPGVIVCKS